MKQNKFPSSRELLIEVFWSNGDDPFVCGVSGPITLRALSEIENEISEWDDDKQTKDGCYLYRTRYQHAQVDEFGRVELAGYWELELIDFLPILE